MANNEIGEELKRLRERRGFTITELARRCEVSQPFISQIESGKRKPSEEVLKKIGYELGAYYPRLLYLSGHTNTKEYLKTLEDEKVLLEHRIKTLNDGVNLYLKEMEETNDEEKRGKAKSKLGHTKDELRLLNSRRAFVINTIAKLQKSIGIVQEDSYDLSSNKDAERYITFRIPLDSKDSGKSISDEELKKNFLALENLFTMAEDIYLNEKALSLNQKERALKILKLVFQNEEE